MNKNRDEGLALVSEIESGLKENPSEEVKVIVAPPYPFLGVVESTDNVKVAAQNCHQEESGAFTGEVATSMLASFGCDYCIVGHSERRQYFGESDEQVADKFAAVQSAAMTPILCVGETLEQRDQGKTLDVVAAQIAAVINRVGLDSVCEAIIAYEPVWAIGTGKTASSEQAQEVHLAIRQQLGGAGEKTRILYGGSVKAANAAELFLQPDIDGALVGGASLDANEFSEICKLA